MTTTRIDSLPWRIANKIEPTPPSDCWAWMGSVNHGGYGQTRHAGKQTGAHRAVYEIAVGPIPEGLTIDHLCKVRSCVNPSHMEVVTMRENNLRGNGPAAINARKTNCGECGGLLERDPVEPKRSCPECRRRQSCRRSSRYSKANRATINAAARVRYAARKHKEGV